MKSSKLTDFLETCTPADTIVISDYDGTIHRGLFPPLCRGIANADFGVFVWLLHVLSPHRFFRLSWSLIHLLKLERALRKKYRTGRMSLSVVERKLIQFFVSNILKIGREDLIFNAAVLTARWYYPHVPECFKFLSKFAGRVYIVSKSFEFVLDSLVTRLRKLTSLDVVYHGVSFKPGASWEIDETRSILEKSDKLQYVRQILSENTSVRKVLILGDTEEDIPLKTGAVLELGEDKVFFIAINAKDTQVVEACDMEARSWQALNELLGRIICESSLSDGTRCRT